MKKEDASTTVREMLEDRSYMRADPHRTIWSATVILMIVVTVCFAIQEIIFTYGNRRWIVDYLALSAGGLKHGYVWQLLTFQFLHVGLLHILFNVLGLWFFGRIIEERLGSKSFLKLYFLSGVAGGLLQAGLSALFPNHYGIYTFGASAGVCGLFAAYAMMEPHSIIRLYCIIPIKALHFLWIFGGIAAFFTLVPSDSSYAHAAHLGGYLAGIGFMRLDLSRFSLPSWKVLQGRKRKRQLVQTATQFSKWRGQQRPVEAQGEEFISNEVDPILDKISAHGIHSLTPREREILEAARSKMSKR